MCDISRQIFPDQYIKCLFRFLLEIRIDSRLCSVVGEGHALDRIQRFCNGITIADGFESFDGVKIIYEDWYRGSPIRAQKASKSQQKRWVIENCLQMLR